jgi:DNA topoisomerase-1
MSSALSKIANLFTGIVVTMTSLLIVESPAKCSKIQGFLGPGWKVIATMGHIRSLEETLDAIGIERDFEPRYAFLKTKSKAIDMIKESAKNATKIFLASDDDREGEMISYSVATLLKLPLNTARIVFREITKEAITSAIKTPRTIDMNRVNAQQARAILDMLIGFTISPLLWKSIGNGLSAGRCQTPALRLTVEREKEVKSFTVNTVWNIKGTWSKDSPFEAMLTDSLEDETSATNYMENLSNELTAHVSSSVVKGFTETAPSPLITSTLQQEASALYKSNPKATMQSAQRLYEQGYITYMRTDNPNLSEGAKQEAIDYVTATYGIEYVGASLSKKKVVEGAQEAHEAIRPTHMEANRLPEDEDWSSMDRKIYSLIWNRTIQSIMASSKGEVRTVIFKADGDPCEFDWKAVWRRVNFMGWRTVSQQIANLDEEEPEPTLDTWAVGEKLTVGSEITWSSITAAPKDSRAPPRYTEATLVRDLEKRGIGRPSTFAALIGTIVDKTYVEIRDTPPHEIQVKTLSILPNAESVTVLTTSKKVGGEKQKLVPTELGTRVLEFCINEFTNLFAYEFTKKMETRLDMICDGKEEWKRLCHDTWNSYKESYERLKDAKSNTDMQSTRKRTFTNGITAVQSKKGPVLLIEMNGSAIFYGWPEGVTFKNITEEIATRHVDQAKKEKDNSNLGMYEGFPITRASGPFGTYVAWSTVKIPWVETDTLDMIYEKLKTKNESVLHSLGSFEFRKGPYGVYMFKKDVTKNRKFVGIPTGVDPKALTLEAATRIYQTGIQQKAKQAAYKKNRD